MEDLNGKFNQVPDLEWPLNEMQSLTRRSALGHIPFGQILIEDQFL